jgi:hypothetical protein
MSIASLLEVPEQQSTLKCSSFEQLDSWNDSVNVSSPISTWTSDSSLAMFENSNNQRVTSLGTYFDIKPEFKLWDEPPYKTLGTDSYWYPLFDSTFPSFTETPSGFYPDLGIGDKDSDLGFALQDTMLQQSAPLQVSNDNLSLWDLDCLRRDPSEQAPERSALPELSPASSTPPMPESYDSQSCSSISSVSSVSSASSVSSSSKHNKSARGEPRHRCPINHCPRHDGKEGFHRKDHLIQHLRTLHSLSQEDLVPSFCPHTDCQYSEVLNNSLRVFSKFRDYSRHLKNHHKESLFDCSVPGCPRKGANGYSGQANLLRHVKKRHPELIDKVMGDQNHSLAYLANMQ